MKKLWLSLGLGVFLVFTHQIIVAQDLNRGKEVFENRCARCHGANGEVSEFGKTLKPFPARDLRTNLLTYKEMKFVIKYGLYRRAMIGQQPPLSDSDIENIIAYIRTLKYEPDIKHGEQRFIEVCSVCHGKDATGQTSVHAANLRLSTLSREEMAEVIRYGRHNTPMTAKRDVFTNVEIADIIGYLMSIRK